MVNKLNDIVSDNPFSQLNSSQINLYFFLRKVFSNKVNNKGSTLIMKFQNELKGLEVSSDFNIKHNDDGSISISNNGLAWLMGIHPRTASVALTALKRANAIDLKYIPDKNGEIRKIYWKGLPNV